ncbi:MAG TPA: 5'-nucleotidase C-terminal domain-containing protein [Spirochaetota bacterium]|nr:5'-nucleotidase C-terminal domain-containing protein [Spirochaetota bacterium]
MKSVLFLLLVAISCFNIFAAPIEITILFTNDVNGRPLAFSYNQEDNLGGLPARASLIKKLAGDKKKNNVLVVDTGNFLLGRPESNLFDGLPDIVGMNLCGYDVVGLGYGEIYKSKKYFDVLNKNANFYILSSNIKEVTFSGSSKEIADAEFIKKFGNVTVGVFSVTSEDNKTFLTEQAQKEFTILDPLKEAKNSVENIRGKFKADIVIALTTLGYYEDNSKIGSNTLASNVSGIDIIIDGNTGLKLEEPVVINKTKIVQAFRYGLFVGEIKLKVDNKKIVDFQYKLHPVNYKENGEYVGTKLDEDPAVLKAIKDKMKNYDTNLNKKLVTIKSGALDVKSIRQDENPLGNLICDALLDFTKAQIAFQNAGGIVDDQVDISKFNRKSLDKIIKYDNSVVVLNLTGKEIREILETSFKRRGYGAFLQVGGLRLTYSKNENLLSNVKVKDLELNDETLYKVAINSWLANGGDDYSIFKSIPVKSDYGILVREVVYNYLEKKANYSLSIDGRMNIIGE